MEKQKGLIHIYWGNGKGKSSAALGAALRASGHNNKVHLVHLMKHSENPSGEILALKNISNFSHRSFGLTEWCTSHNQELHKKAAKEAIDYISLCFNENKYDLIIADEILYALQLGLIEEEEIESLIKTKPENMEFILTGSHIPFPNLFKLADYVTEIKCHKHPFNSGIQARKGVEF